LTTPTGSDLLAIDTDFMKRYLFIILLLILGNDLFSQLAPHKYLVKFTDKNNSPYTTSDPSQFLSAKAIARRVSQGITIKENDLPVTPAYLDSVKSTGVTVFCHSKWFNSATIYTTDTLALNKINSFPFVKNVSVISRSTSNNKMLVVPEKFMYTGILNNNDDRDNSETEKVNTIDYGYAYNQTHMISLDYLHNLGYCGQGMTIAVIDAGFSYADTISAFDSLWANNQILGTRDFVNPGNNVFREYYHGMMVLSIMGANNPGQIVGTAPKAKFWLLRTEDVGSENIIEEYNWASAAEFADSAGADIINSSLGYTTFDSAWMSHTYSDMDGHTCPSSIAAATAASKGMIVCNSAGNSAQQTWHYIGAPADADSIITVGAVDASGTYAAFSSTGPSADGRVKPTIATQGQGTYVVSTSGTPMAGNGTSFASPVMAGATACLWQAFPNLSNMQIIEAIEKSASQYSSPDSLLGYGIPNFAAANLILLGIKIDDINNDNTIDVFPNPFSDVIYLMFSSSHADRIDVELFDISGKKLMSEKELIQKAGYNYYAFFKVNALAKGIYILNVTSPERTFSKMIVKSN
jgi:serine protease AprX